MGHAKSGFYFDRRGDGEVHVFVKADSAENAPVVREVTLTKDEWAAVVADVSATGPSEVAVEQAAALHSGVIGEPTDGDGDDTSGISSVKAEIALDVIANIESIEDLDSVKRDEEANEKHPGGRKGVLQAIEERRAVLLKG